MLVILDRVARLIVIKEAVDNILKWTEQTHKEYCEMVGFDYDLFEKIYNNDLSVTIEELISFADCLHIPLRDFVIIV